MATRRPASRDILDGAFGAPTPAASLQLLTTVGSALRPRLRALTELDDDAREIDWTEILTTLARVLAQHLEQVENVAELATFWRHARGVPAIAKLGDAASALLDGVQNASGSDIKTVDDCVELFHTFNRTGFDLASGLIADRNLGASPGRAPVDFSIVWDPSCDYYCAGTTRADRRIVWAHQPVQHGLYAALIPELVFAHEYFSHLTPRNPRLSRTVTEVWLVDALKRQVSQSAGADAYWQAVVWELLRDALSGANPSRSVAHEVRRNGLFGVDTVASLLYGNSPAAFWRLTRLIVTFAPTADAGEWDALLKRMVKDQQSWSKIGTGKWATFNDLDRIVN